jgi:hypothetical protein
LQWAKEAKQLKSDFMPQRFTCKAQIKHIENGKSCSTVAQKQFNSLYLWMAKLYPSLASSL